MKISDYPDKIEFLNIECTAELVRDKLITTELVKEKGKVVRKVTKEKFGTYVFTQVSRPIEGGRQVGSETAMNLSHVQNLIELGSIKVYFSQEG